MILGVYWYFGFPEGLYDYEFFRWKPGYGGHANNLAELEASVFCPEPAQVIDELWKLIKTQFVQGSIYVYNEGSNLKIGTAAYHLYDYDFELMKHVEEVLKTAHATLIPEFKSTNKPFHIRTEAREPYSNYKSTSVLKRVGSSKKKSNAETSSLRLDCNLPLKHKKVFLQKLETICVEEKINVLYYCEAVVGEGVNLMLFLTNGRQGLHQLIHVNFMELESKILDAAKTYDVVFRHEGGWDYYPQGNRTVVKIVDAEYIL